jgi:two-component system C4-dicarboxylate transport response regulator DctD
MTHEGLKVIFIEDDELVRRANVQSLQLAGVDVEAYASAEAALPSLEPDLHGIVVCDVKLPGMSGLELLTHCHQTAPDIPVILVTGHGDITMAVHAMRDGAYDFIEKPFAADRLIDTVRRALSHRVLWLENRALRRELAAGDGGTRIIGNSLAIAQVREMIANIAPTDVPVLINGDTGAGKELVARRLHELSARGNKPFVALNCGALPEAMFETEMFGHEAGAFTGALKRRIGKLEHASGGTLFLDEIESMSPALQVKLLRVLENGLIERLGANQPIRVDIRIIAAAKGEMEAHVEAGRFRRDLLYRLNVVTLSLPPLAARRDDIVPLFEHFVLDAAVRYQRPAPLLSDRRRAELTQREWPGNIRELRNAADRFVLGVPDTVTADQDPSRALSLKERTDQFEQALITDALRENKGAVTAAAAQLQLSKATLYEKIKRYGLQVRAET